MRPTTLTLSLCFLVLSLACGARDRDAQNAQPAPSEQNANATATTSVVPLSPTCALLSSADVESVQGEAYASAQGSEHLGEGLVKSQCFYRLPTFGKSINLEVVRVDPNTDSLSALKKFWDEKFSPEALEKRERERELRENAERVQEKKLEREKESGQLREGGHEEEKEDEEETERPRRINGLGEAAFWTGGESGGSLHVLLKDASLRVSIGGEQSEPARIKSAVALARKVLTHF
jgi:hypothetical protein